MTNVKCNHTDCDWCYDGACQNLEVELEYTPPIKTTVHKSRYRRRWTETKTRQTERFECKTMEDS